MHACFTLFQALKILFIKNSKIQVPYFLMFNIGFFMWKLVYVYYKIFPKKLSTQSQILVI